MFSQGRASLRASRRGSAGASPSQNGRIPPCGRDDFPVWHRGRVFERHTPCAVTREVGRRSCVGFVVSLWCSSGDDLGDDLAGDVGEAEAPAVVFVSQAFVIEPEQPRIVACRSLTWTRSTTAW